MRLATLNNGTRDGELVVVSRTGERFVSAGHITPTLQSALDSWTEVQGQLEALSAQLDQGLIEGRDVEPS